MLGTYEQSNELLVKGERLEPTILARRGILGGHPASPIEYPVFAERASGAFVYDIDGNRYTDFILGFGSVVLGHCDPLVDEAVIREIRRGVSPSLLTRTQVHLATLFSECVPGAEMVTFLRSGSDATSAAVRLARAATGRRQVLRWGYQGWHDWCAPRPTGIPEETRTLTTRIEYNDLPGLDAALRARPREVACVIMMPLEVDLPNEGYLCGVRDLCRHYEVVFILDEVRSGFRLHLGGAQAYFNVRADLAVFSKAMANGYAISALAGSAQLMRQLSSVSLSSVFFRSSDGMAAALATIQCLRDSDAISRLWQLGRRFQTGLKAAGEDSGLPVSVVGTPPMPHLRFRFQSEEQNICAMRVFCEEMLRRGVLLHPNHHWFVCSAMRDEDIDHVVSQFPPSFQKIRQHISVHPIR
jgi:glutamate-1-semialdehyde 2,1-aminomutase